MAYRVIEQRISQMGFCCPYSYLFACRHTSTPDVAVELGVHKRSVRRWRVAYRTGALACTNKDCCLLKAPQKKPEQYPYSIPLRALDLDLTPDAEHSY